MLFLKESKLRICCHLQWNFWSDKQHGGCWIVNNKFFDQATLYINLYMHFIYCILILTLSWIIFSNILKAFIEISSALNFPHFLICVKTYYLLFPNWVLRIVLQHRITLFHGKIYFFLSESCAWLYITLLGFIVNSTTFQVNPAHAYWDWIVLFS